MAMADAGAKVSELATRYVSDNVQSWQRYAEELRRVSEGAMKGTPGGARGGAPAGDIPEFTRQLVQLNLAHYSKLLNSYAEFTNGIIGAVFQSTASGATASPASATPATPAPAAAAPAATPTVTRIELVFEGVIGESVSQPFAVANRKSEAIDVAFELSEFASEDGSSRFRVPVTFVPESFVLSPGAERVVECRVPLVESFKSGTRYMSLVRVIGFPTLETALIVLPRDAGGDVADYDKRAAATPPIEATVVPPAAGGAAPAGAAPRAARPDARAAGDSGADDRSGAPRGRKGKSGKGRKGGRKPPTST